MSLSTFEEMQQIEEEAQLILERYKTEVVMSLKNTEKQLQKVADEFDEETHRMLADAQKFYEEKSKRSYENLRISVQENNQQLQAGLADRKEELIDQIIAKVVEFYGN